MPESYQAKCPKCGHDLVRLRTIGMYPDVVKDVNEYACVNEYCSIIRVQMTVPQSAKVQLCPIKAENNGFFLN